MQEAPSADRATIPDPLLNRMSREKRRIRKEPFEILIRCAQSGTLGIGESRGNVDLIMERSPGDSVAAEPLKEIDGGVNCHVAHNVLFDPTARPTVSLAERRCEA